MMLGYMYQNTLNLVNFEADRSRDVQRAQCSILEMPGKSCIKVTA